MVEVANVIAAILIAIGLYQVAVGLWVGFAFDDPTEWMFYSMRYLRSPSGEAVDRGALYIVGGIVLGLLAKIAKGRRN